MNTNIVSTAQAFRIGYRTGKRTSRFQSAREALSDHPIILGHSNIDSYLNGVDDGAKGDSWRYDELRKAMKQR